MQMIKVEREYHMKCDICGKEEVYPESPVRLFDYIDHGWSRVEWLRPILTFRQNKELHLCPKCTRKLAKLIRNVELEEPGSTCE